MTFFQRYPFPTVTDDIANAMISASQMIYASRMKGTDIIMSAANNKVPGYPLEIFDFVSGSGSYIIFAKQIYHTA